MIIQGVSLNGVTVVDVQAVTSGLMYYIDAGNATSYSGSGTSINNIAGTAPSAATLFNGPTFTSAGSGSYFSFNGTNQGVYTANILSLFNSPSNKNLTIETWVRTSSDNGVAVSEQGASPINSGWHTSIQEIVAGNLRVRVWSEPPPQSNLLVGAVTRNQWQQYTITYDNATTTMSGYINGSTTASTNVNRAVPWEYSSPQLYYTLMTADGTNLGDGSYLAGDWAVCKIYNRALSAAEVTQNFNALRGRYGL